MGMLRTRLRLEFPTPFPLQPQAVVPMAILTDMEVTVAMEAMGPTEAMATVEVETIATLCLLFRLAI